MKGASFLFMLIACGALRHGTSYAGFSNQGSEPLPSESHQKAIRNQTSEVGPGAAATDEKYQTNGKPFHEKPVGSRRGVTKATPKPAPNYQKRSDEKQAKSNHPMNRFGIAADVHQPGSTQSMGAATKALEGRKPGSNRALSVRPRGVVPLGGPSFNAVRPRGAEPAAIGGPTISTAKTTGAIRGTGLRNRAD